MTDDAQEAIDAAYTLGQDAEYDEGAPSGMDEAEIVAFYEGKEDAAATAMDWVYKNRRDRELL